MIIDYANWRFRLHCSLKRYVTVDGVNSKLPDNKHILLWDFDDTGLTDISNSLLTVQSNWDLSNIYIVESSKQHYHAYCFDPFTLGEASHILADTKHLDMMFFKLGIVRGYWTLRISEEKGKFNLVTTLHTRLGQVKHELLKTVEYKTEV